MTTQYEISYAPAESVHVRVAVVDRVGMVDGLAPYLPLRWATRHYESLYGISGFDLLVLGGASPAMVRAARVLHPEGRIIAVIDPDCPVDDLIGILSAGADACVRAGAPAVLAGHLLASNRRRLRAERITRARIRFAAAG